VSNLGTKDKSTCWNSSLYHVVIALQANVWLKTGPCSVVLVAGVAQMNIYGLVRSRQEVYLCTCPC
jgi:hypothetical protein